MSAGHPVPSTPPISPIKGEEIVTVIPNSKLNEGEEATGAINTTSIPENAGDPEKNQIPPVTIDEKDILTGKRLLFVWSAFLLSVLLIALDNTIVSTALPKLASQFEALDKLTWIVSGYLLTQAGFILIYGQILTVVPTKWVYLFTIFIFEVGSLICAVAPTVDILILGRAVAGTGAAGIYTAISTVASYATKLEQRPLLFGTVGGVFSFASVVGPLIGGALTDKVSWRWCFYINLPLGACSIVAIAFLLPPRNVTENPLYEGKTPWQKFLAMDFVGGILSLATICALLLPLQWGGNEKQWNDPLVIGLLGAFSGLVIIFVLWEWWMGKYAMMPLHMFKNRTLSATALEVFFIFFCFLLGSIYLPFLYQAKGSSAVDSGIKIIPFSIATVSGTLLSGAIIRLTGNYKPWLIGGPFIAAIGGGLFFTVNAHTSDAKLVGYQILLGFGCGSSFQNTLVAIQAEYALEPVMIPQASSIVTFSQLVGGTIGISIGGTVFANELVRNLGPLASQLGSELVRAVRQSVIVVFQLPQPIQDLVVDAYIHSLATMFIVTVPTLIIAGLLGFAIKGWNLKQRN